LKATGTERTSWKKGDPRGRSGARDQRGQSGTLLRVLKEVGVDGKTPVGGAANESRGVHSASVRGEAFVRRNADLEKSLTSYFNN
jgi:hypothetical protein